MRKHRLAGHLILGLFLVVASHVYAETEPFFTIVPIVANSNKVTVALNNVARITYQVTNNRPETLRLTMKPIFGVTQDAQSTDACTNPFSLASGKSCLLMLRLAANQLSPLTNGGPVICKTTLSFVNIPDDSFCSHPDKKDELMVTVTTENVF